MFATPIQSSAFNFHKLLKASNFGLLLSFLLFIATLLICYPYADHFSIPAQIASHIGMILTATLVKVTYVSRCVSLHGLGREVR